MSSYSEVESLKETKKSIAPKQGTPLRCFLHNVLKKQFPYIYIKKKTFNILRLLVNQSEHELGLKKDFWLLSLLPISNQTFTAKGKIH